MFNWLPWKRLKKFTLSNLSKTRNSSYIYFFFHLAFVAIIVNSYRINVKMENVALDLYIFFYYFVYNLKASTLVALQCCNVICFPNGLTVFFSILCIKLSCVFINYFFCFFCVDTTKRMSILL